MCVCLTSTTLKKKIRGINSTACWKGGGLYRGASMLTSHIQCPHPPGVIKCLSYSAESVSTMYQLFRVSSCHLWDYICPTDQFNFDGREDIIVFPTGIIELSQFFPCLCLCWMYRNLLSITSCRSLEFSFLLHLMTCSLWYVQIMEYIMV